MCVVCVVHCIGLTCCVVVILFFVFFIVKLEIFTVDCGEVSCFHALRCRLHSVLHWCCAVRSEDLKVRM